MDFRSRRVQRGLEHLIIKGQVQGKLNKGESSGIHRKPNLQIETTFLLKPRHHDHDEIGTLS